jgi:hypothetical protein
VVKSRGLFASQAIAALHSIGCRKAHQGLKRSSKDSVDTPKINLSKHCPIKQKVGLERYDQIQTPAFTDLAAKTLIEKCIMPFNITLEMIFNTSSTSACAPRFSLP